MSAIPKCWTCPNSPGSRSTKRLRLAIHAVPTPTLISSKRHSTRTSLTCRTGQSRHAANNANASVFCTAIVSTISAEPVESRQCSGQPQRFRAEVRDRGERSHSPPPRSRPPRIQRNFAGAIRKGKIEIHNHARRRLISRQPGSAIKCQRHFHHFPGSAAVSYRLADAPPRTGGLNSHGDQRAIRRQRNGQTCEGERQFSKPTSASPRPEHDRHEHWDNT